MRFLIFLLAFAVAQAASTPGTVWRDGATVPANTLGVNGDYYLHRDSGAVYKKAGGVYAIVANLKGPRGDTGATGQPGQSIPDPTGNNGEFLYSDGAQLVYSKNSAPNPTVSISLEVAVGKPANFTANAWGPTPMTYQWSKNGTNIPGATGSALVFTAAQATDAGTYLCLVTNVNGATSTRPATLVVQGTAPIPPPGGFTAYATVVTLGTQRNNYTGWVGARVTVGSTSVRVSHLGRFVVSGNTRTHRLKLVRESDGQDLGTATLTTAGATPGQFSYVALAAPVTLAANTKYYVLSEETSGGDFWYDHGGTTRVTVTSVAALDAAIYGSAAPFSVFVVANQPFGPVNFGYTP